MRPGRGLVRATPSDAKNVSPHAAATLYATTVTEPLMLCSCPGTVHANGQVPTWAGESASHRRAFAAALHTTAATRLARHEQPLALALRAHRGHKPPGACVSSRDSARVTLSAPKPACTSMPHSPCMRNSVATQLWGMPEGLERRSRYIRPSFSVNCDGRKTRAPPGVPISTRSVSTSNGSWRAEAGRGSARRARAESSARRGG